MRAIFTSLKDKLPLDIFNGKLIDNGPVYAETNLKNFIVEPWNAVTALLFIALAVFMLYRLRGRYQKHGFITIGMVLLLIGGIGGALYHGFRTHEIFMWLDVVPIFSLAMIAAIYLWNRILPSWKYLFLIIPVFVTIDRWVIPNLDVSFQMKNSLDYVNVGMAIIIPLVGVLLKTRFRYYGWVMVALAFFGMALFFRIADSHFHGVLSMGSHWLWHSCGVVASALFTEYLIRLNRLVIRAQRRQITI